MKVFVRGEGARLQSTNEIHITVQSFVLPILREEMQSPVLHPLFLCHTCLRTQTAVTELYELNNTETVRESCIFQSLSLSAHFVPPIQSQHQAKTPNKCPSDQASYKPFQRQNRDRSYVDKDI